MDGAPGRGDGPLRDEEDARLNLLLLSYWFPCPAANGSQVRLWNLARRLARRHRIALLSFIEAPPAAEALREAESVFARVETVAMPAAARSPIRRAAGWLSPRPSSVAGFTSEAMTAAARRAAKAEAFDCVIAWELAMAPFALAVSGQPRFLEGVEATPALSRRGDPLRVRIRRWKLRAYLRALARGFDGMGAVSDLEAGALQQVLGAGGPPVAAFGNGVDLESFPWREPSGGRQLIYYGSPGYEANRDAIEYFCAAILPAILAEEPAVRLIVTGQCRPEWVPPSARRPEVTFTGYLEDPRPALQQSAVAVAPLRVGGGTRIKIVEAMALGTPVVATSVGAEGLDVTPGAEIRLADAPEDFARGVLELLRDPARAAAVSRAARQRVEACYDWDWIAGDLDAFLRRLGREDSLRGGRAIREGAA